MRSAVTARLAAISLFFCSTFSLTLSQDQVCVGALQDVYGDISFIGFGYGDYYTSLCQNPLAVISMYAAAKVYCNPSDIKSGFDYLSWACQFYGGVALVPQSEVAANLTDDAIRAMPVVEQADIFPEGGDDEESINVTTTVLIAPDWFKLAYHTEDVWDYELRTDAAYGFAMYGFWGGILVIGMLNCLFTHFYESRLVHPSLDAEDSGTGDRRYQSPLSKTLRPGAAAYFWIRKYLVTPSTLPPYRRQRLYYSTIPTRIEAFVITSYWALSIILCGVNYRAFPGNFFGRNNIFQWMTGWQFSTFNLFHRHIARVATLQAIVHSVGYTVLYFLDGDGDSYRSNYQELWWTLGVVATVVMSFLVILSFGWFRAASYEFFLIVHIVLSIVVIVGLFYHTSIFEGEYDPYLWPLVAIWGFDRLLRIVRVIYYNVHVNLRKGEVVHRTKGTVICDEDANILRIDITPAATHLRPGPGQHYFLYQPFRIRGWENHPFTLASWSSPRADGLTFSFWVRPRDGWTRRLRDQWTRSREPSISTALLLEGPYGRQEPLWTFDEVLLIAGGTGIAAIVPYVLDHVRRSADSRGQGRATRTRAITLVWAERNGGFIRQVVLGDLAEGFGRDDVTATLYNTSLSEAPDSSQPTATATSPMTSKTPKGLAASVALSPKGFHITAKGLGIEGLEIRPGRPGIRSVIETAALSARETSSRLAIMVCGPPQMADAARQTAYQCMDNCSDTVEYFEEAFGW